ncbi:M23 family metallopeptidase, partial [Methylosinus sp. R-45379]|uniref:M23 family metallopeptidase n=1 Tax=Methylosinus sp. R-45379 TaxID=980563 RepID=UPI0012ED63D6
YAHLDRADVAAGQCVFRGQAIGAMGQTGVTTGVRLHFELREAIDRRRSCRRSLDQRDFPRFTVLTPDMSAARQSVP